tara:strand:+ start:4233 stop:4361 length:129 start_codon:yes stop_codon:yes gene_type:complete
MDRKSDLPSMLCGYFCCLLGLGSWENEEIYQFVRHGEDGVKK